MRWARRRRPRPPARARRPACAGVVDDDLVDDLLVLVALRVVPGGGHRLRGGADRLERRGVVALATLAPPPRARAALGEVAQQVARERAGLARQPRPRTAQHLL